MKLFKISQTINNDYDTFDSAIVCAVDEFAARRIHPIEGWGCHGREVAWQKEQGCWAKSADDVQVEEIGIAKDGAEEGVVLASFNAG